MSPRKKLFQVDDVDVVQPAPPADVPELGLDGVEKRIIEEAKADDGPLTSAEMDALAEEAAAMKLDAEPLQSFADGVAQALGLQTSVDKALAEEHLEKTPPGPAGTKLVPIGLLVESAGNPRHTFSDLEELADSIRAVGVLEPIMVRELTGRSNLEVVDGARRLRASKMAGLVEVPVDVRALTDVQTLEIQLVKNVQRSDLTAIEEAEGYQRLMTEAGYSADQVAQKAGKKRGWVYSRLKLLELGDEGRKAVEEGRLSTTVAVALARVATPGDQAKALAKVDGMASREALDMLRDGFTATLRGAPFKMKDDMLVPDAGACVACQKRSGSGTPGLFEDLDGKDVCTDVACFRAKCRASWEAKADSYAKAGAKVLSLEEGQRLYRFSNALVYGGTYVEADAPAEGDQKKRSWTEQIEKLAVEKAPKLVVACDTEWALHRLYNRKAALSALAEADVAWAKREEQRREEKETRAKPSPEKEASEKEARAIRDQVVEEVLVGVAKKVADGGLQFGGSIAIVARRARLLGQAAVTVCRYSPPAGAFKGLTEGKEAKWLEEASANEALSFVAVCLFSEWAGNTWESIPPELQQLAEAFGLDLQAMVKAKTQPTKAKEETKEPKVVKPTKTKKGGRA